MLPCCAPLPSPLCLSVCLSACLPVCLAAASLASRHALLHSRACVWLSGRFLAASGGTEYKLFVGSMSLTASESDMRALFEPFGNVINVTLLMDREKGSSKGCGFVIFGSADSANAAIMTLHGKFLMTGARQTLTVQYADTRE